MLIIKLRLLVFKLYTDKLCVGGYKCFSSNHIKLVFCESFMKELGTGCHLYMCLIHSHGMLVHTKSSGMFLTHCMYYV